MDNRIKIGAAIGTIIVAVVVLLFIFVIPKSNSCKLQDERPKLDIAKATNYKTGDNKAMANFVGYLIYPKEPEKNSTINYLELDLESISQTGTLNGPNPTKLKLATSCCDITVVMPVVDKKVNFYLEIDDVSSDGDKTACTIASPASIEVNQYYSCQKPQTYHCMKDKKLIAELQVERIEFEVDGDPKAIKKGNFSKEKRSC